MRKNFFLMHFNPGTRNCDLKNGAQDSSLWFFFLNIFYLFDSIFQRWKSCITWWRNLFSQQYLPWKSEKDNFSTIISMIVKNVSSKKKKKMLQTQKADLIGWVLDKIKRRKLENVHFVIKSRKVKKHDSSTFKTTV